MAKGGGTRRGDSKIPFRPEKTLASNYRYRVVGRSVRGCWHRSFITDADSPRISIMFRLWVQTSGSKLHNSETVSAATAMLLPCKP